MPLQRHRTGWQPAITLAISVMPSRPTLNPLGTASSEDYVGHGIGTDMHEDPEVPNYGMPGHGELLEPGMVLALEPMINMGTEKSAS